MFRIDCHSHFFEPSLKAGISKILKNAGIGEETTIAEKSNRPFLTAEERLKVMDQSKIDVTTIEYQIVWQHYDETKHPVSVRLELAKFINDQLAEAQNKYPARYFMMADIPLLDVQAAVSEIKRCQKLGTKGICLNTSVVGKPLTTPEFDPVWVEIDQLGLPVFLHPRSNLDDKRRAGRWQYHAMLGYPFDTTIAGVDFLATNFFEKYPHIRVMLCHSGGALPFIKRRLDMIEEPKISTMLNKFFYDTAISFPRQLEFTIDEVGLDSICFGSDYPYYEFSEVVANIETLKISSADKEKIFNDNPRKFFGIN